MVDPFWRHEAASGGCTTKSTLVKSLPCGVVTLILPVEAPPGTTAFSVVSEATVNCVAFSPLKSTAVVSVKFNPFNDTNVPTWPLAGVKESICGGPEGSSTVNAPELNADPSGVDTRIGPVVAPEGTLVLIWVSEGTVKVAEIPLRATDDVPEKPEPESVTAVPTSPLVGVKELIWGTDSVTTVKEVAVDVLPNGVATLTVPVVAPTGTLVVISVSETTLKAAVVPLKLTFVAPVRALPVKVTAVPSVPLAGEKELITGGYVTVKLAALEAVPRGVATLIVPVVAPAGTPVVISVCETTLKVASTPSNVTDWTPLNSVPRIVTGVPTTPLSGVKEEIVRALGDLGARWALRLMVIRFAATQANMAVPNGK